jgi:signal transduction histidine kinase
MSLLDEWLEKDYDVLVDAACEALSTTQEAAQSARPAVETFYNGFIESSRELDLTPLNLVLSDWVEARSAPTEGEVARFLPVLLVLKRVTADLAVDRNPHKKAVSIMVLINNIMDEAVTFLSEQEIETSLGDVRRDLERAQKGLRQLDKSKSDFIAVAAHELKTPLTLMEGYANMLREEFPADQYPRVSVMLGGLSNGTIRLREIIEDMVDVSLIDMKILELHMQPVWLGRLVDIVVSELEPTAQSRNLTVKIDKFEDENKPVYGDPERLHQVFRNVILNAVKYTPDGGTITISADSLPEFFDVQVSDTGIGIDRVDLERIFDRFAAVGDVALHSSGKTKFKGGGPGLGLAIAKGIVEAHGGNIWAESPGYDEVNCPGSTFHILIPVRSTVADDGSNREHDYMMGMLLDATNAQDEEPEE